MLAPYALRKTSVTERVNPALKCGESAICMCPETLAVAAR